jgi:hypothetical protein
MGHREGTRGKGGLRAEDGKLDKGCGFCRPPKHRVLRGSPDGLVDDGLIEIKCPNSSTFLSWILAGVVPEDHKPQMALQAACTGRPWVDFVAYDPRMPEPTEVVCTQVHAYSGRDCGS